MYDTQSAVRSSSTESNLIPRPILLPRKRVVSAEFVLVTSGGGSYSSACTERVDLKRKPTLPRESHVVSIVDNAPQTMRPVPYETTI